MTFKHSLSGVKDTNLDLYESNDFQIKIGQSEMKLPSLLVDLISPRIAKMHKIDPTINSFTLSNDQKSTHLFTSDIKELIRKIVFGEDVEFSDETSYKMRFISLYLENIEIYNYINVNFPLNKNSEQSYLNFLIDLHKYECYSNSFLNYNELIDNISGHFNEIEQSKLYQLPSNCLLSIISNKQLKIKNEDSLLDIITNYIVSKNINDEDIIISLYEQIDFLSLSEFTFSKFINEFDFNKISSQLWRKISQLFYFNYFKKKKENVPKHNCIERCLSFVYDEVNRFKGIINYLNIKHGGNVHRNQIVEITASSKMEENPSYMKSYGVELVVDLDKDNYFNSNPNDPKMSINIIYDFKNRIVRLNSYSIRSRPDIGKGGWHLISWFVEGTNDPSDVKNWKVLDKREDDYSLDDKNAENTFETQYNKDENEYFRYLRIRAVKNSGKTVDWAIVISALEFFGTLYEKC